MSITESSSSTLNVSITLRVVVVPFESSALISIVSSAMWFLIEPTRHRARPAAPIAIPPNVTPSTIQTDRSPPEVAATPSANPPTQIAAASATSTDENLVALPAIRAMVPTVRSTSASISFIGIRVCHARLTVWNNLMS